MTHLPHENWSVEPFAGPHYKVGPECAIPDCRHFADHAHHLWRRSHLGKASDWVQLWDGHIVGNLVPLCFMHHDLITRNLAWIQYVDETQLFRWVTKAGHGWAYQQQLTFQPPVGGELETVPRSSAEPKELTADQEAPCPTCGRHSRRARSSEPHTPGERRPRASWSISVPSDEREKGADVLDELLEGVLAAFGREHHTSSIARYWGCLEAFVFTLQNQHLLVEEGVTTQEDHHEAAAQA